MNSKPALYVADDWGLSRQINEAILYLAKKGLIQRVSAISDSPYFEYLLPQFLDLQIPLSFHFNLTAASKWNSVKKSFNDILILKNNSQWVQDEFELQWEEFKKIGRPISALESHQYIHALPSVARELRPLCEKYGLNEIRKHKDWRHPLATLSCSQVFRKEFTTANYFKALKTQNLSWIKECSTPMVIHPAVADSNDSFDSWRKKRVTEFKKISHFWSV